MILFVAAFGLQSLLLFECVLRRVLACFLPSTKSNLTQYADKSVIATGISGFSQVFALPLHIVFSLANTSLSVLIVALVITVLSVVLSEYTASMLTLITYSYNTGIAPVVNTMLELATVVNGGIRFVLPVLNALMYIPSQLLVKVVGPVAWQYAELIPQIISNCSLAATAFVMSVVSYIQNVRKCSMEPTASCDDAALCGSSFTGYDVNCFANPAYMTIDVMTTGVYTRKVFLDVRDILQDSCAVSAVIVNLAMYPLTDFNLYKAVHCLVNIVMSPVYSVVATASRCKYLQDASPVDRAVGCTPDFLPIAAVWIEMLRALGTLIDNWLNTVAVVVLESITGQSSSCAGWQIESTVSEATQVFEASAARVRVVGLTETTVAITDGLHAMYRSDYTQAWGSFMWPMPIAVQNGVAAVQANLASEGDDANELRTGLLGCTCIDVSGGIELACATVPLMGANLDLDSAYNASTIHSVEFGNVRTDSMTCAGTLVRVMPLKFSKRRLSVPANAGLDVDQNDPYNVFTASAAQVSPFTVDAAIYVQPLCQAQGAQCLPLTDSCYPWCMGLHVAGLGAQHISIMNAERWEEYVSLRQSDCGVGLDDGRVACKDTQDSGVVETLMDGRQQPARCSMESTMCTPNDHVVSSIPVAKYAQGPRTLSDLKQSTGPVVRTSDQPFAVAGDVMLTVVNEEVEVTRLYDAGFGFFGVAEELTIVRNARKIKVTRCDIDDTPCYVQALVQGQIVMPVEVFSYDNGRIPAASSKWAVHWAVNPDPAVLSALYNYCYTKQGIFSVIIESSWSAARVWSLKTGRAADLVDAGTPDDASRVSYMRVPGFQSARDFSCDKMFSLKVVALEYLNAQNVLVTVLEGRAMDVDPLTGDVCADCVKRYRYFYLNPERRDCVEPKEGEGTIFSCWREGEQWQSPDIPTMFGRTCPPADRMPRIGSAIAETVAVAVWVVRLVLDSICVIPAAVAAAGGWHGITEVMRPRLGQQTFHSMLDTSGVHFMGVEEIIRSVNRASMHMATSLVRTVNAFRGLPGADTLRQIAVGTAKILQHSDGIILESNAISRQLGMIQNLPSVKILSSLGEATTSSVGTLPMGIPAQARMFVTMSSVMSLNLRLVRRALVRLMQASNVQDAILNVGVASVYESKDEFASFLDSTRAQCHGIGDLLGGQSPWAQMVRHACQLGPDSMDFVLETVRVMFVEYPVMSCTCRLGEGERLQANVDLITSVCLSRFSPASQQRWMLELLFRVDNFQRRDMCYASMDAANARLRGAMDLFLNRMYRLAENAAEGLDYVLSYFSHDRTGCNSYLLSPYVLSLIPQPADYWMTCMETDDCRVKCVAEFTAFDQALLQQQDSGRPLVFEHSLAVRVESHIFPPYTVQQDTSPPFEIYGLLELPETACTTVCDTAAVGRCIAISGIADGQQVEMAYYCLPVDITMYLFEYTPSASGFESKVGDVIDMFFLTGYKVSHGQREWLLVVEATDPYTSAFVVIPGMQTRTMLFESADVERDVRHGSLQSVTTVRVVPALEEGKLAYVFAIGIYIDNNGIESPRCLQMSLNVDGEAGELTPLKITTSLCLNSKVVDPLRRHICLDNICSTELLLPAGLDSPKTVTLRYWSTSWNPFVHFDETDYNIGERAYMVAQTLGADFQHPVYQLKSRAARKRAIMSPTLFAKKSTTRGRMFDRYEKFELLTCNAVGSTASWMNVVHLQISDTDQHVVTSYKSQSTTVEQTVDMSLICGIDNCVGCIDPTSEATLESLNLQSRCYAAQECGLTRCVGTLVNMRKPLCSLGKILAQYLHFLRVALGGLWHSVSKQVVMYVELSEERRKAVELTDDLGGSRITDSLCQVKDLIVQISATFTSFIGAISVSVSQAQDQATHFSTVDSRVHARLIMTLTAVTNFIASVFMAPLYLAMFAQTMFSCSLTQSIMYIVDDVSRSSTQMHILSKHANGNANNPPAQAEMCLGAQERELMRDIANNEVALMEVAAKLLSGFVHFGVNRVIAMIDGLLDAILTYLINVITALQDILVSTDWENCKLPTMKFRDVGNCACGDHVYSIPDSRRNEHAKDGALWCSGLMLITAADGSDLVIWNPYSLSELLSFSGIESYFDCLVGKLPGIECHRPDTTELSTQGAELLQVVAKCRSNYQQMKWDDASVLYSLFEPQTWSRGDGFASQAAADDQYVKFRQRVLALSNRFDVRVDLDTATWKCLRNALETSDSLHRCHELHLGRRETHFAYLSSQSYAGNFLWTDACRTFTGQSAPTGALGASKPPYIWSTNGAGKVPVALAHDTIESEQQRFSTATRELKLVAKEIRQFFERIRPEDIEDNLKVAAFTTEGDEVHQLVDCIVLGPYAAAEIPPGFVSPTGHRTTAAMYHRGDPSSRLMARQARTGGSTTRQKIIQAAVNHIENRALPQVAREARTTIEKIRSVFLEPGSWLEIPHNLLCTCRHNPTQASLKCCSEYESREDIHFGVRDLFDNSLFDMQKSVTHDLLDSLAYSNLLKNDIWTNDDFAPPSEELPESDRDVLAAHQLFNFTHGARSYRREEVATHTGGKSLWTDCMEKLSAPFFTLPMRTDGTVDADVTYDPVNDDVTDPADGTDRYLHVVEQAVARILKRAEEDSPVFWSNANRYVPTDSVWCETQQPPAPRSAPAQATIPRKWMGVEIDQDTVLGPALHETIFPGDTLARCFCGWASLDSCAIPADICADPVLNQTLHAICSQGGSYSTRAELLLVIRTLQPVQGAWRRDCDAAKPSIAWGLLDAPETQQWYENQTRQWSMDLHTLATRGPAGMRLSHVGTAPDSFWKYTRTNSTGAANINTRLNHTAAQPVCESTMELPTELHAYFQDVFFPMAHSVHQSPVKAACSRWVIEHALQLVFTQIHGDPDTEAVRRQTAIADTWRVRCVAQLQQVGACELRGVFDISPPSAAVPPPHCKIRVPDALECTPLYYTPDCLVRCGPDFFDPCVCDDNIEDGGICVLDPTCQRSKLRVRDLFISTDVQLLGMRWPTDLMQAESHDEADLDAQREALRHIANTSTHPIDFAALYQTVSDMLRLDDEDSRSVQAEGAVPQDQSGGYCEDLLDYWDPDAQHPIGYHPSMGCSDRESNVRGFDAWMSADENGEWAVDPLRMRDMTQYAEVFGASNMVCDAAVFGAESAVSFNDLYLNTKWDPASRADPAVPSQTPLWEEQGSEEGIASRDPHDTPLVDPAMPFLPHTVGLIRDWVFKSSADEWPHWATHWTPDTTEFTDAYASSRDDMVCAPPLIKTCSSSAECGSLVCRQNGGSPGVCMRKDTCSQHLHCPEHLMCSGDGKCVAPKIIVRNRQREAVAVQVHSAACEYEAGSHFQHIPNFPHANGLCKFRNWFHLKQLQSSDRAVAKDPWLLFPRNTTVKLTDRKSDARLDEWIHMNPHTCERSYHAAPAYGTCRGKDIPAIDRKTGMQAAPYWLLYPEQADQVRVCDLRHFQTTVGFLSPYYNYIQSSDDMLMIDKTVRRCWEFQVCPEQILQIDGRAVQRRKVRVAVREEAKIVRKSLVRDHCPRDVERCWGMGYLLGYNCSDAITSKEETCVVDVFVLPLVWIVFGVHNSSQIKMIDSQSMDTRLQELRQECPRAFEDISFIQPLPRMTEFYTYLGSSFHTSDREKVSELSNELLLSVFGVSQDQRMLDKNDADFAQLYFTASRCASYVLAQAEKLQATLQDTYDFEALETGIDPLTPGNSFYVIVEYMPLYVPFNWLWQCAILGGAQQRWLQFLATGSFPECVTYDSTDNPASDTIKHRMIKDMALYEKEYRPGMFADQVVEDLDQLMAIAVALFEISSSTPSCVADVLNEVRSVLISDLNDAWHTWSLKDFIDKQIIKKRNLEDNVGEQDYEFPYLRFTALTYDDIGTLQPLHTPSDNDTYCLMQSKNWLDISKMILSDKYEKLKVFFTHEQIQANTFTLCVNAILLFVDRNMRLMPSFAGHEYNILKDQLGSMRMERASAGTFTKEITDKAKTYNKAFKEKQFECQMGTYDSKAETNALHQRLRRCVDLMQEVGGWVVDAADHKVQVSLSRRMHEQGFYLSVTEVQHGDQWLSQLFSQDIREKNSEASAVCFMRKDGPQVMNPFWAGEFDIASGCDTSRLNDLRYIDVKCASRPDKQVADKRTACLPQFQSYIAALEQKVPPECMDKQYDILFQSNLGSLEDSETPLCDRTPPEAETCDRVFGALHGYQGSPLTAHAQQATPVRTVSGLWDPANIIARGSLAVADELLALQTLPNDIAGHSIIFELMSTSNLASFLRLECLNLHSTLGTDTCLKPVTNWLSSIESAWERQHTFYIQSMPSVDRRQVHWHCPLQWLTAYSGLQRSYRAQTPNRERTFVLFAHLNRDYFYAHPTVASVNLVHKLRPARFMSEFLACGSSQTSNHVCHGRNLLIQTINKLRAVGQWHEVQFLGIDACDRVLDWPHTRYTLRDQQDPTSDNTADDETCNVYDRLPRFAISVQRSSATTKPSIAFSPGGVCHMGRLPRLAHTSAGEAETLQRCRVGETRAECLVYNNTAGTQRYREFARVPPFDGAGNVVRNVKGRRCTACNCSGQAGYVDASGHRHAESPVNSLMSTGVPMKLSTERLLAGHVRRHVCGTQTDCPKLQEMFDLTKWQRHAFLPALLQGTLAQAPVQPAAALAQAVSASVHEHKLWTRPWVYCKHNTSSHTCSGSIARHTWASPQTRADACVNAVKSNAGSSGNVKISFCLLNAETEELCAKSVAWRNRIQAILCKFAGTCPSQAYFYSPSTYSIANQEFVHDTVLKHYQSTGTQCVASTDAEIEWESAVDVIWEKNLDKCSAYSVQPFKDLLKRLRLIRERVMRLMYYAAQIVMKLLEMLVAAFMGAQVNIQAAAYELFQYVEKILVEIAEIIQDLANAMAKFIFAGGQMKWLLDFLIFICHTVNSIKVVIDTIMCKAVFPISTKIFEFFAKTPPFSWLGVFQTLLIITRGLEGWMCSGSGDFFCDALLAVAEFDPPAKNSTPVATRCWSTYVTFFGDSQQLSCLPTDTCKRTFHDQSLTLCGTCGSAGVGRKVFGCSAITKQCTCDVQDLSRSTCMANSDCQSAATCQYVDSELRPSTGVVQCEACQAERFCLFTQHSSTGVCSCGLSNMPFAECSSRDYKGTAQPPYAQPCMYQTDARYAAGQDFRISFADSAAIACHELIEAFCMYVEDQDAFKLVGLVLANRRRRLLAEPPHNDHPPMPRASLCRDAAALHMPHTLRDCVQACERSSMTVRELELTGSVPECAFGSTEDLMLAIEQQPALLSRVLSSVTMWPQMIARHTPLHAVARLANTSGRAAQLMAHMAAMDNMSSILTVNRTQAGRLLVRTANPRLVPHSVARALQTTMNLVEAWAGRPTAPFPPTTAPSRAPHNVSRNAAERRLLFAEVLGSIEKSLLEFDSLRDSYASQMSTVFDYRYADVDTAATRAAWLYDRRPGTDVRDSSCQLFSDVVDLVSTAVAGLQVSLQDSSTRAVPVASLREAWQVAAPAAQHGTAPAAQNSFSRSAVNLLGLSPAFFYDAFANVVQSVKEAGSCDYLAVQTCSKWRIHLFHGIIIVGVWFSGWFVICSVLNMSFLAVLTMPAFAIVVMSLCYGYAPTCSPMVPVCFFEDVSAAWRMLMPRQMAVPQALLLDTPACRGTAHSPTPLCIRSCADPPLAFATWYSPAAWIAVELGAQELPWLAWIPTLDRDAFDIELRLRLAIATDVDQDLIAAHRICTAASLHLLVPLLFAAFMAVVVAKAVLQTLAAIVSSTILTLGMLFASAATEELE